MGLFLVKWPSFKRFLFFVTQTLDSIIQQNSRTFFAGSRLEMANNIHERRPFCNNWQNTVWFVCLDHENIELIFR